MQKFLLKLLEEMEKESQAFWSVPRTTAVFLNMMVKIADARKVLEIGTSNGYSGIYLAEALSGQQGMLTTVESHKQRYALARKNFEKSGLSSFIEQVFGHAPEVLKDLVHPFDFIFLDATKLEYRSYAEILVPQLKSGGLLIADNCVSHQHEMKDYLDFVIHNEELQSVLLPFDNGLMLSRKLGDRL